VLDYAVHSGSGVKEAMFTLPNKTNGKIPMLRTNVAGPNPSRLQKTIQKITIQKTEGKTKEEAVPVSTDFLF